MLWCMPEKPTVANSVIILPTTQDSYVIIRDLILMIRDINVNTVMSGLNTLLEERDTRTSIIDIGGVGVGILLQTV